MLFEWLAGSMVERTESQLANALGREVFSGISLVASTEHGAGSEAWQHDGALLMLIQEPGCPPCATALEFHRKFGDDVRLVLLDLSPGGPAVPGVRRVRVDGPGRGEFIDTRKLTWPILLDLDADGRLLNYQVGFSWQRWQDVYALHRGRLGLDDAPDTSPESQP
jgi:hypothetical protein